MESRIALVGEAWGKEEAIDGRPFVGPSGRILNHILAKVGIARDECLVTNVLNFQPKPTNDIISCCGPKKDAIPSYPALTKGKYLRKEFASELPRLYAELSAFRPNVVVALGGTAAWALLKSSGIKAIRGAPAPSFLGWKVIPTYHPAAIMRDWTLNPIVYADLEKARAQSTFPEYRRPNREIWVEPTHDDLITFETRFINTSRFLSIDVETKGPQITCISFAPTNDRALVVPFFSEAKSDGNYWPTWEDEMWAWAWIRRQCAKSKIFLGQNFQYDMKYLWTSYGITFPNAISIEDTMLLHHSLQPEMEKGLAFLGSIYTDEAAWKLERNKGDTLKREE